MTPIADKSLLLLLQLAEVPCEKWSGLREAAPKELRGKHLACWCPLDQPCHRNVLLEVANS